MSDKHEAISENAMMFSSLMDLATFDTSDLKAQVSRLAREGLYIVELGKIQFAEQPPQDPAEPMNYTFKLGSNILEFAPLDKNQAVEDMAGRTLNEGGFLNGKELKEAIQLLMGRFKQVGLKHKGILGGVEGSAPGWVDEAAGKRVAIRVRHYVGKDGQDRAAFDWLSYKQMEKAEISWDIMARDFVDGDGNPADPTAKAA